MRETSYCVSSFFTELNITQHQSFENKTGSAAFPFLRIKHSGVVWTPSRTVANVTCFKNKNTNVFPLIAVSAMGLKETYLLLLMCSPSSHQHWSSESSPGTNTA